MDDDGDAVAVMSRSVYFMLAVAVAAVLAASACGSSISHVDPDKLATAVGATWCQDSSYYLQNRLDGSKEELYSCNMPNGSYKCVTTTGGVDRDVFASQLSGDKPDCVRLG